MTQVGIEDASVQLPFGQRRILVQFEENQMSDLPCPIVGMWTIYNNEDRDFLVQKIVAKVECGYYLTQIIAPQTWTQIAMTLIHISKLTGENRIFCDNENEARGWAVARQLKTPPGLPS